MLTWGCLSRKLKSCKQMSYKQIAHDLEMTLFQGQGYRQATPGVRHIQLRSRLVQYYQSIQEALPRCIVHRSGEGGWILAVRIRTVKQQQAGYLGVAHPHHLKKSEERVEGSRPECGREGERSPI